MNQNLVYFYYNLGYNNFHIAVVYLPTHQVLWSATLSQPDLETAVMIISFKKDSLVHLRNEKNRFNELAKISLEAKNEIEYIDSDSIDFLNIPIVPQS
jgi:hypothetical protein